MSGQTSWQWILKETVLAVHDRQIAEHGGAPGVRDMGLLESGLARPGNLAAYGSPEVHELAAAYAWGIIRDQPFLDGNKRTAYVTSRLFLVLHGHDLTAQPVERVLAYTDAGAGAVSEAAFTRWFATGTRPR